MSKRKIAYARKTCIDPEEEGETLPFPPREIVIHKDYWFDRDYELCDLLLGRGKFGEVKKCVERESGMALAAKIVNTRTEANKEDVRKEIRIMSQLRHPKVLQIYDAFESRRKMCLITELVEGGELFDRIVDPHFDLTERVAILFMRQIVDGIGFIHSQNILHLDMKPENIICVAKTGTRIKIIDFGLAMRYDSFSSSRVIAGTIDFMSPEVCNYEDVTPATDMWSVGVICYVLVSGLSPFCGDDDAETICNIVRVEFDFAAEEFDEITAGCKDFIKKLLVKDPRKRMSAEDCLKHSWLNKITRSQTKKHLSKKHHIKFFIRRKWKKVIKAVVALNRMKMLVRMRAENRLEPDGDAEPEPAEPEQEEPKPETTVDARPLPPNMPEWRLRLEAKRREREANRGDTVSVLISGTARRSRIKSSKSEGPSSLSYSSGYESSGSTKLVADDDNSDGQDDNEDQDEDGEDEDETVGDEEDDVTPVLEKKEFFRLQSDDTVVDESDANGWAGDGSAEDLPPADYADTSLDPIAHSSDQDTGTASDSDAEPPAEMPPAEELGAEPNLLPESHVGDHSLGCDDESSPADDGNAEKDVNNRNVEETEEQKLTENTPEDTELPVESAAENADASPDSEMPEQPSEDANDNIHAVEDTVVDATGNHDSKKEGGSSEDDETEDEQENRWSTESQYSSRSSTQLYCPTDTLDNIVSAITRVSSSRDAPGSNHSSNASVRSDGRRSYASGASNSSVSGQRSLRRRSNSIPLKRDGSSERSEEGPTPAEIIRSRRSSRTSNDLPPNMESGRVDNNSGWGCADDAIKTDKYRPRCSLPSGRKPRDGDPMTASFSGELSGIPVAEGPESGLRGRYGSENSIHTMSGRADGEKPGRRVWSPRISPSPVRETNSVERRRARIAAICGDEYLPPVPPPMSPPPPPTWQPTSHLMERIIPIEIEGSVTSGPAGWNHSSESRPARARISHSPIRGRVSQSPLRSDAYGVRMSPIADYSQRVPANTESKRRARIDAIVGADGGRSAPGSPPRPPAGGSQKSASRINSDEARHRRIAAILCNANDCD